MSWDAEGDLRIGLYNLDSGCCNNCMRRRAISKEIRQRGGSVKFSVNSAFMTRKITPSPGQMDPLVYINSIKCEIGETLRDAMRMHTAIKFYITVNINMMRFVGVEIHREVGHFPSIPSIVMNEVDIEEQIQKAINLALDRAEAFLRFGSGWTFEDVQSVDVHTCAYNVVGGSSYIATPKRLKNRSIINIQNKDQRCFAYSVLASLFPAKDHVCKTWKYEKYMNSLNLEGIEFPMKLDQIGKFEKQNPDISINVQHLDEDGRVVPLRASEHRGRKHHINLLLLTESVSVSPEGVETIWDGKAEIPDNHTVLTNRITFL